MARLEFSVATKRAARKRSGGRCEVIWHGVRCPQKLTDGNCEYHHVKDAFYGGDNSLDNCQCACRACHRVLTRMDAPRKAKTRRQSDGAKGIKPRAGKLSRLKKCLDGRVIERSTGRQIWP